MLDSGRTRKLYTLERKTTTTSIQEGFRAICIDMGTGGVSRDMCKKMGEGDRRDV